jgi:hypothetical protein
VNHRKSHEALEDMPTAQYLEFHALGRSMRDVAKMARKR